MNNTVKKVISAGTLMAILLRKFISKNCFFDHRSRRVGPQVDLRWDPAVVCMLQSRHPTDVLLSFTSLDHGNC